MKGSAHDRIRDLSARTSFQTFQRWVTHRMKKNFMYVVKRGVGKE